MRAFVGIVLPREVRTALNSLREEAASAGADVKWVESANLHVTIKFLDEISVTQRAEVEKLLKSVGSQSAPIQIRLGKVGAFPSLKAPRVIWVGLDEGREQLVRIAEAVEAGCRALKIRKEGRPFASHVTIGRVRSAKLRNRLAEQLERSRWKAPGPWRAEKLSLFESVLTSAGARYSVLAEIALTGK